MQGGKICQNNKLRITGMLIKQHRQNKKISLTLLAHMVNLDGNNISRFERGEKPPHLITFFKLVLALDSKADDYLPFFQVIVDKEKA